MYAKSDHKKGSLKYNLQIDSKSQKKILNAIRRESNPGPAEVHQLIQFLRIHLKSIAPLSVIRPGTVHTYSGGGWLSLQREYLQAVNIVY